MDNRKRRINAISRNCFKLSNLGQTLYYDLFVSILYHYAYNYDRNKNVWGGPNISGTTLQPTVYADAYAAARVADITAFGALRVIGEEKWVALFNNGLDSWSEWRRTGYPNLVPATNALNGGVIPRRMIYPLEEQNFNSANYKTALSGLNPGTDSNKSKIWWDQ